MGSASGTEAPADDLSAQTVLDRYFAEEARMYANISNEAFADQQASSSSRLTCPALTFDNSSEPSDVLTDMHELRNAPNYRHIAPYPQDFGRSPTRPLPTQYGQSAEYQPFTTICRPTIAPLVHSRTSADRRHLLDISTPLEKPYRDPRKAKQKADGESGGHRQWRGAAADKPLQMHC